MIVLLTRVTDGFHELHLSNHDLSSCIEDIKKYRAAFIAPCALSKLVREGEAFIF